MREATTRLLFLVPARDLVPLAVSSVGSRLLQSHTVEHCGSLPAVISYPTTIAAVSMRAAQSVEDIAEDRNCSSWTAVFCFVVHDDRPARTSIAMLTFWNRLLNLSGLVHAAIPSRSQRLQAFEWARLAKCGVAINQTTTCTICDRLHRVSADRADIALSNK